MQRPVRFQSGITANGTYCQITASNPSSPPYAPVNGGPPLSMGGLLLNGTLYCFASGGTTGGVVVPVMLGPDGNYYPLATATTLTAPGFGFNFAMTSAVIGLAIQVTTPVTGGSVFLCVEALQV